MLFGNFPKWGPPMIVVKHLEEILVLARGLLDRKDCGDAAYQAFSNKPTCSQFASKFRWRQFFCFASINKRHAGTVAAFLDIHIQRKVEVILNIPEPYGARSNVEISNWWSLGWADYVLTCLSCAGAERCAHRYRVGCYPNVRFTWLEHPKSCQAAEETELNMPWRLNNQTSCLFVARLGSMACRITTSNSNFVLKIADSTLCAEKNGSDSNSCPYTWTLDIEPFWAFHIYVLYMHACINTYIHIYIALH